MANEKRLRSTEVNDYINQCVGYLNNRAGKHFTTTAATTVDLLSILYGRGVRLESIIAVIDLKTSEWGESDVMRPYLRPSTLFDVSNFWRYLKQTRS